MGDRRLPSTTSTGGRLSSHKPRSHWFQARAAWPWREANGEHLASERQRCSRRVEKYVWTSLGPTNVGGRLTCMVGDPNDARRLWVGSAGGGVWRTDDAGASWTPQWDNEDTLNIGSLAIDPGNPKILYCGTGEANLSGDSYPGVGLYVTEDGGVNWHPLAGPTDPANKRLPRRIGALVVHPKDPNRLLLGGVAFERDSCPGAADGPVGGLWASDDKGKNWRRHDLGTFGDANYWCHAVVFDPHNPDQIYVTVTERGARSGIWCSRDGGSTWEHLLNGLPDPERFHRTSLAVAPSRPEVVYAVAADRFGKVLGVFRSDDEGRSWRDVSAGKFGSERGMTYNNTIAVHPNNPDLVVWGGVDLYRTLNAGGSWEQITSWQRPPGHPSAAHADHHALLFPRSETGWLFSANDGGLAASEDLGDRWEMRSAGLVTTQFYDLAASPTRARYFGGGTQDNGTLVNYRDKEDSYFQEVGGDGGWLAFDPEYSEWLWATVSVFPGLRIYQKRGALTAEVHKDLSPAAQGVVPFAVDPRNARRLLTATEVILRSEDEGADWKKVEPGPDGSQITAIEISLHDSNRCYAGTEYGAFVRSTDGGATWSENLAGATLPSRTITRIRSAPRDSDFVVVTVAGRGHGHVFLSTDGGTNWRDIDQKNLPDLPHQAVEVLELKIRRLLVVGDAGVYMSSNEGKTWECLNGNLPNVMMTDVVYDATVSASCLRPTVAACGLSPSRASVREVRRDSSLPAPPPAPPRAGPRPAPWAAPCPASWRRPRSRGRRSCGCSWQGGTVPPGRSRGPRQKQSSRSGGATCWPGRRDLTAG